MRLLLLTNMPSYHQMQLAKSLAVELGSDNFRLVFHKPTSEDRREMGWDDHYQAPYLIRYWESAQAQQQTLQWIESADVVVQGRFPLKLLRRRIAAGKLTFCYQERFWKRQFSYVRLIGRLPRLCRDYWSVNRSNYHLLAAGAYVAPDLNSLGLFRQRSWKYGYFIEPASPLRQDTAGTTLKLLWCARFSSVKQPLLALEIMRGLQDNNLDCQLTMIGDGELRPDIEAQIVEIGLEDHVRLAGWQSGAEVADAMQAADALLMTSDYGEGWALVINEAIAQGCAVIATRTIGSAPWLVKHGETGLMFDSYNIDQLLTQLRELGRGGLLAMGQRGQDFHRHNWCAQVAAHRLVQLSQRLIRGDAEAAEQLYADGPCSPA